MSLAGAAFGPRDPTSGHIAVELFTLRASEGTRAWLDRAGAFLMAVMFLVIAWRIGVGTLELYRNGGSSMLVRFPMWVGYALTIPGVLVAALIALVQSFGIKVAEHVEPER